MQLSGAIGASVVGLTKDGAGTVMLSGNNAYTGLTNIFLGTLRIQSNNALGATGAGNNTNVVSGAALELDGTSGNGALTIAEAATLNGTGISNGGALRNSGGNNTDSGAITLGSASQINSEVAGQCVDHYRRHRCRRFRSDLRRFGEYDHQWQRHHRHRHSH